MSDFTEALLHSKCEKDFYGQHSWMSIGVVGFKPCYQVFKCSQCLKVVYVELEPLMKTQKARK